MHVNAVPQAVFVAQSNEVLSLLTQIPASCPTSCRPGVSTVSILGAPCVGADSQPGSCCGGLRDDCMSASVQTGFNR